jgi:branched-chain amino acid transport system ATP-binding protein
MEGNKQQKCLIVTDLDVHYGALQALSNINMEIRKREIVAILGPNAGGKSTLVYTIAGVLQITKGKIVFNGERVDGLRAEEIVELGISLIPEGRLLFARMKVSENLELGAYRWRGKRKKREINKKLEEIFRIFPMLKERKHQMAGTLSGGQQQMIALGRGLMSEPKLLLLDEPSLGLAPVVIDELMATLVRLRREMGLTIVLSEQNAVAALDIADRAYVMGGGKIVMEGSSEELCSTEMIKEAYLGIG